MESYSHLGYYGMAPPRQVFQQDIECVLDAQAGLGAVYIGNKQASQNLRTLKRLGIGAILTAAKGIQLNHPKSEVPFYLYIPAVDHQSFNLTPYFQEACRFIQDSRRQTNVLVHCMAGVSRSVSLVLAYMIKRLGMSFDNAYTKLKLKRRIINPNEGFVEQLRKIKTTSQFASTGRQVFYSPSRTSRLPVSSYQSNRFMSPQKNLREQEALRSSRSQLGDFYRREQPSFKDRTFSPRHSRMSFLTGRYNY